MVLAGEGLRLHQPRREAAPRSSSISRTSPAPVSAISSRARRWSSSRSRAARARGGERLGGGLAGRSPAWRCRGSEPYAGPRRRMAIPRSSQYGRWLVCGAIVGAFGWWCTDPEPRWRERAGCRISGSQAGAARLCDANRLSDIRSRCGSHLPISAEWSGSCSPVAWERSGALARRPVDRFLAKWPRRFWPIRSSCWSR